ncbi:hypothetical protein IJ425_06835 [bacterium]|nr:hypothetical protein [bacterium]
MLKIVFTARMTARLSEDVLQGYLQALKTRFDNTNNEEANERLNLAKQLMFLDSRFDRLKKTYLDGDFSREEYLKEKQDIELEQKFLENKIAQLSTDNKEFEITLEYLLELTSKINFLYESSRIERKRKILNLVFLNFFLNGSSLSYELKKPFDLIVKKAYCLINWEQVDTTRTDFNVISEFFLQLIIIDNDLQHDFKRQFLY